MYFLDYDYLQKFMSDYDYPVKAKKCFTKYFKKISSSKRLSEKFEKIAHDYMYPWAHDVNETIKRLRAFARITLTYKGTTEHLFWICCSKLLKERYKEKGIDDKIYFDTMNDLKYKLIECIDCKGICGTFTEQWYHRFFDMTRFSLGRFQFEMNELGVDYHFSDDIQYKKGTPCLAVHIPSSGIPLTDDVRLDAYKRAYEFFPDYIIDGKLIFGCGSWLLYKKHREFLPKKSNILRFMDDFDIVSNKEKKGFGNGWRVFGKFAGLPYRFLPEDTSLRKAYKDWLIKTGKSGDGYGIIIFDGEKIVNKRA
jgi:hypothetical protein